MRNYTGYDRVDMISYSEQKLFDIQLKAEGKPFKLNNQSSITIDETPIELKAIFRMQGQELKDNSEERSIRISKQIPLKVGDYIEYLNDTYILTSEVDKDFNVFNIAKLTRCNQTINLKGWTTPIYCIAKNDSYGVKLNESGDNLAFRDAKLKVQVQKNDITKAIKLGTRFIFDNSEDNVYRIIDKTSVVDQGTIVLMMEKVESQIEDDFANNIAFNGIISTPPTPIDYSITGASSIRIGTEQIYTLENAISTVEWIIDDIDIAEIINTTFDTVTIKGKGNTDEILTLIAKIDGIEVASTIIYITAR